MVPCPWARDAAAMYRGEDVGVHLTLNVGVGAPTAGARSPTRRACSTATAASRARVDDVWDHADLDEVRKECRAQIERAIYWGFDVSHLDSHMGTLQLRRRRSSTCTSRLAVDFRLPLRMARRERPSA